MPRRIPPPRLRAAAGDAALRRRLHDALHDVFGLETLRDGQDEAIAAVLARKPTLAVMPTGGGKSLCYQLPALLLPGPTLVVSPLISLMKDQCDKLGALGVAAVQFNSALGSDDLAKAERAVADGSARIVFTTPERLGSAEFVQRFANRPPSLLVIDEAHCISQWGHDFRPAFLEIGSALPRLGKPTLLALTATATPPVIEDIARQLRVDRLEVIDTGVFRANLRLRVDHLTQHADKLAKLVELVTATAGAGIVYCSTVRAAVEAHGALCAAGVVAGLYHGRLGAHERREQQEAFMSGRVRVVVATNAFGLGIDKPDTRFVVHHQVPGGLDAYYQEAGRAGRDGEPALCQLLYLHGDRAVQRFFLAGRHADRDDLTRVYGALLDTPDDGTIRTAESLQRTTGRPLQRIRVALNLLRQHNVVAKTAARGLRVRDATLDAAALDRLLELDCRRREREREKLEEMTAYAQSGQCRWGWILEHFGEADGFEACGTCDSCERIAAAAVEAAASEALPAPAADRASKLPTLPPHRAAVPQRGRTVIEPADPAAAGASRAQAAATSSERAADLGAPMPAAPRAGRAAPSAT